MRSRHLESLLRHQWYYLPLMVFNIKFQFPCFQLCLGSITYLGLSWFLYTAHPFSAKSSGEAENGVSCGTLGRSDNPSELSFLIDQVGVILYYSNPSRKAQHFFFFNRDESGTKDFLACVVDNIHKVCARAHTCTHTHISHLHNVSLQFLG